MTHYFLLLIKQEKGWGGGVNRNYVKLGSPSINYVTVLHIRPPIRN